MYLNTYSERWIDRNRSKPPILKSHPRNLKNKIPPENSETAGIKARLIAATVNVYLKWATTRIFLWRGASAKSPFLCSLTLARYTHKRVNICRRASAATYFPGREKSLSQLHCGGHHLDECKSVCSFTHCRSQGDWFFWGWDRETDAGVI